MALLVLLTRPSSEPSSGPLAPGQLDRGAQCFWMIVSRCVECLTCSTFIFQDRAYV